MQLGREKPRVGCLRCSDCLRQEVDASFRLTQARLSNTEVTEVRGAKQAGADFLRRIHRPAHDLDSSPGVVTASQYQALPKAGPWLVSSYAMFHAITFRLTMLNPDQMPINPKRGDQK